MLLPARTPELWPHSHHTRGGLASPWGVPCVRVLWGSVLGSLYIRDHVGRWAVPSSPWALCLKAGPSDSQLAGGAPWTVAEGRTGPCRWTATSETTPSPVWAPGAVAQAGCPCGTPAPGAHTASRCRHVSTTDTSSASEDEGPVQRPGRPAAAAPQSRPGRGPRLSPGSSTSSSASSASSQPGGSLAGALAGPAALGHGGQYRPPRPCTRAPRASGPTGRLLGHRGGCCCGWGLAVAGPWCAASPRDADEGAVSGDVRPVLLRGAGLARGAGAGGRSLRRGCTRSCWVPLARSLDIVPTSGSGSCPCGWLARVGPGLQPPGLLPLRARLNSPRPEELSIKTGHRAVDLSESSSPVQRKNRERLVG